jgi:glutaredoxin
VVYYDVLSDKSQMERMLSQSKGERKVPVIVDQGQVIIGYQGKG